MYQLERIGAWLLYALATAGAIILGTIWALLKLAGLMFVIFLATLGLTS